jgi:hypothetical protein
LLAVIVVVVVARWRWRWTVVFVMIFVVVRFGHGYRLLDRFGGFNDGCVAVASRDCKGCHAREKKRFESGGSSH